MLKSIPLVCLFVIIVLTGSVMYTYAVVIADSIPKNHPEVFVTKDGCTTYKWYDKGERMYSKECKK